MSLFNLKTDTKNPNTLDPISNVIRKRIEEAGASFNANDNISEFMDDNERESLKKEIEFKLHDLFDSMLIDTKNDHNTKETAKRVAKMFVDEIYKGRYHNMPPVTDFPNAKELDEIYTLGPISVRSACSHHFVPILGQAWVGIKPSDRVIGISKFNRLTDWIMSRPHIQEEAVVMLADKIEELVKPKGIAVVVKASHLCMISRGVKETNTSMVNSIMRGEFRENASMKKEFMDIIRSQGFDSGMSTLFG